MISHVEVDLIVSLLGMVTVIGFLVGWTLLHFDFSARKWSVIPESKMVNSVLSREKLLVTAILLSL